MVWQRGNESRWGWGRKVKEKHPVKQELQTMNYSNQFLVLPNPSLEFILMKEIWIVMKPAYLLGTVRLTAITTFDLTLRWTCGLKIICIH